jgi:hypothetical protein
LPNFFLQVKYYIQLGTKKEPITSRPLKLITTLRPKPHIVVASSPGKAHAYWRVIGCDLEKFTTAQWCIAYLCHIIFDT